MSNAAPGTLVAAPLMDRLYRHQRHIYDLTRKHYLLGRDRLIADLKPPPGSRVLEIGCGTARNLVLAARCYPEVEFYGIDISFEMLETARRAVVREGLTAHIQLAQGDATRFDPALLFGVPSFARIFVSYSLSMIPAWPAVLATAVHWLAPEGELHIVDFGRQERLPTAFRVLLRGWLRQFHVEPRDELEVELRRLGLPYRLERPFRGYAQYAVARQPDALRPGRFPHGPSAPGTSGEALASHAGRC
jgi:S-adenosylmethionine-diacylgycerolhomoserine-N-methlytransferase